MGGYIATLDDGADRLNGVSNAFAYLGEATKITRNPKELGRGPTLSFSLVCGRFLTGGQAMRFCPGYRRGSDDHRDRLRPSGDYPSPKREFLWLLISPGKSGESGLFILRNFVSLNR